MADKMHQEIEEILARLDKETPPRQAGSVVGTPEPGRAPAPISFEKKRKARRSPFAKAKREASGAIPRVTPAMLLFAGAGVMVVGLIGSSFIQPMIWVSLAGVFLFLGAFAWSFIRSPREAGAQPARGVYWRDRYIEYEPANPGPFARLKRKFRR